MKFYQLDQEIECALNTQKENAIAIDIMYKLDHVHQPSPNTYICKVNQDLRMMNEKAYEPMMLSIGPYHYSKRASSLRYMEEVKLRCLNQLIKQVEHHRGISKAEQLNNYVTELKDLEDEARACYMEAITLSEHEFIEMMLLDGCFIIKLFDPVPRYDLEHRSTTDPLFKVSWILNSLAHDLILLENQLPFFILEKLYSMIFFSENPFPLIWSALNFHPVYYHLPFAQSFDGEGIAPQSICSVYEKLFTSSPTSAKSMLYEEKLKDIKHFLDLIHKFILIEETVEVEPKPNQGDKSADNIGSTVSKDPSRHILEYSATELSNLGVRFKGIEVGKFYNIKFEHGVLEIPIIRVHDDTEVIFRNLIAYEEHAHGYDAMYIAEYMCFMNGLIDCPKDVELLCRLGILSSFRHDDEAISTMFCQLVKNVTLPIEFYYDKTVQDLTKHCEERKHVWMAALRRNHLSSPWMVLSTIAASVLLIATLLQTVYTVLSYYKNK